MLEDVSSTLTAGFPGAAMIPPSGVGPKAQGCSKMAALLHNDEHSHARVVVEQAFGALKRRFPILYNIARLEPPKLQMVVVACVILYNISIILGAQSGQPLSGRMRATVPHPPPGVEALRVMDKPLG
ncbi:hypothetical protein ANCCEY_09143 [Ancylostoma ceylanicum]|uniref:DDE Tnp4 domain-containing protein n=1 Tax=Ancylostoma ceylanicum TaxID=53326 RepID=A0A0D6LIG1_9BILA|nr:hypothetical protein ANCCEY_09143 [Ancylostoma ceylanicum]